MVQSHSPVTPRLDERQDLKASLQRWIQWNETEHFVFRLAGCSTSGQVGVHSVVLGHRSVTGFLASAIVEISGWRKSRRDPSARRRCETMGFSLAARDPTAADGMFLAGRRLPTRAAGQVVPAM